MSRCSVHLVLAFLTIPVASCSSESVSPTTPSPDRARFEAEVYPILLRDCGFPACHGATARFYRIFGPGRTRLSDAQKALDEATEAELTESYERTRSMLRGVSGIADAPLLQKPLAVSAGGAGHKGHDDWGRDVYTSKRDPAYRTLVEWAYSEGSTSDDVQTMP